VVTQVVTNPTLRSASRRPPNLATCCSRRYSTASARCRTRPRCPYTRRTIDSPPCPISFATERFGQGSRQADLVWRRRVCRGASTPIIRLEGGPVQGSLQGRMVRGRVAVELRCSEASAHLVTGVAGRVPRRHRCRSLSPASDPST
jgi:hypothetical protein